MPFQPESQALTMVLRKDHVHCKEEAELLRVLDSISEGAPINHLVRPF